MIRLASSACIIAAVALAGCSTGSEPLPAATMRTADGTPVVSSSATAVTSAGAPAHRSGFGIIESISLVNPPGSASAGGTSPAASPPVASAPYRITMRMDDGTLQTLIVDTRAFLVGDRVQILSDGRVVRS